MLPWSSLWTACHGDDWNVPRASGKKRWKVRRGCLGLANVLRIWNKPYACCDLIRMGITVLPLTWLVEIGLWACEHGLLSPWVSVLSSYWDVNGNICYAGLTREEIRLVDTHTDLQAQFNFILLLSLATRCICTLFLFAWDRGPIKNMHTPLTQWSQA